MKILVLTTAFVSVLYLLAIIFISSYDTLNGKDILDIFMKKTRFILYCLVAMIVVIVCHVFYLIGKSI